MENILTIFTSRGRIGLNLFTKGGKWCKSQVASRKSQVAIPVGICFFLVGFIFSCQSPLVNNSSVVLPQTVKPITVTVAQGDAKQATSMQANVKVFRQDSRQEKTLSLKEEYKYAIRIAGGTLTTRMDKPGSRYNDLKARSIFNDGQFVTVVSDGSVISRTAIPEEVSKNARILPPDAKLYSRIDAKLLSDQLARQNFRIESGKTSNLKRFVAPTESLATMFPAQRVIAYSLVLDEEAGAVTSVEVKTQLSGDEAATVTTSPLVIEQDGIPVVVGKVVQEDHSFASTIDTSDAQTPPPDSASLPVLTDEQVKEMESSGDMVKDVPAPDPNLAKKDFQITVLEVYEDVVLNQADEASFRIPPGGAK